MKREKECVELVKDSITQLDKYQSNAEIILTSFNKLVNFEKSESIITDEEKLKAAYALNLCTVSVSQIIEYNDPEILEQEYEMILNNLNLENIPKDEALLNTLKQLLDTITFFRIQSGDKKIIEKQYQQKMKNAIWSAVPQFGLVVAGGNPITMVVSLASQVGIGYMNYRKTRAENRLELEQENWKLQRAAIEQLNGLRRELFDTAWRLADKYNFPDEYRLTEKQIEQYNNILMDTNTIRKFERLDSLKDKFVAYVPFWYHFGNTANQIAQNDKLSIETRAIYREQAKKSFEKFHCLNDKNLLREDYISSACALEYIDLLDLEMDKEKIIALLELAIKNSGNSCDILELCAMAYLKIKEIDSATKILRQLINESYNVVLNAQILSNIYVSNVIYKINPQKSISEYEILETRVNKDYLFPLPKGKVYDIDDLNIDFLKKLRLILKEKYQLALNEFIKKYTIKYNKTFPFAESKTNNSDDYYLDNVSGRGKRIKDLEMLFKNSEKVNRYLDDLKNDETIYDFFDVINDMYEAVLSFITFKNPEHLEEKLTLGIINYKKSREFLDNINADSKKNEISINTIADMTFKNIVYDFFKEIHNQLMYYIEECSNIRDIAIAESKLNSFIDSQFLLGFDELSIKQNHLTLKPVNDSKFSPLLLGLVNANSENEKETRKNLENILKQYDKKLITGDKTELLCGKTIEFDRYISKIKNKAIKELRNSIIAIIDAKGFKEFDLLLTTKEIVVIRYNEIAVSIPYGEIKKDEDKLICEGYLPKTSEEIVLKYLLPPAYIAKKVYDKTILKDNFSYSNKSIDTNKLHLLIQDFDKEISIKGNMSTSSEDELNICEDNYDFLNLSNCINF